MGVWTTISRKRLIRNSYDERHDIEIIVDGKSSKSNKTVEISEEFDLGKSLLGINNWFYQRFLKEHGDKEILEDMEIFPDEFFDIYISMRDIKELLKDVEKALKEPGLASEIFSQDLQKSEAYNKYFSGQLEYINETLNKLIKEDDSQEYEYTISVG